MLYSDIIERCKSSALEMLPDMPAKNDLDSWEDYRDALESLRDESFDVVSQEVDSWDWTIYTHYGIKILEALPLHDCQQAESDFMDCWGSEPIETLNDPWDMASRIAYFALCNMLREALESAIDECLELAGNQIENMEGVA
jgi:hypothetical protein